MDYNGFVQIVLIFQRKLSKRRFPITFVNSVTNFIFVFRFSSQQKKNENWTSIFVFHFFPAGKQRLSVTLPLAKNEKRKTTCNPFSKFHTKMKNEKEN